MAKMPKNDNLVMESIEDLFQQADIVSENPSSAPSQLSREKAGKYRLLVRVRYAGKRRPPGSIFWYWQAKNAPCEQSEPFFSAPAKKEGTANPHPSKMAAIQPESEDPFLAIRQAILSASDPDSPHTIQSSEHKKDSAPAGITDNNTNPLGDQKFADQIARLIDREIELRLKAQISI